MESPPLLPPDDLIALAIKCGGEDATPSIIYMGPDNLARFVAARDAQWQEAMRAAVMAERAHWQGKGGKDAESC